VANGEGLMQRDARDKRITTTAWVLFFAMWGSTALVERLAQVDLRNLQYGAAGLILLGMNMARARLGIPMSRLTLVIGLLALSGGILWETMGQPQIYMMVGVTAVAVLAAEGALRLQARLGPSAETLVPVRPKGGRSRRRKR